VSDGALAVTKSEWREWRVRWQPKDCVRGTASSERIQTLMNERQGKWDDVVKGKNMNNQQRKPGESRKHSKSRMTKGKSRNRKAETRKQKQESKNRKTETGKQKQKQKQENRNRNKNMKAKLFFFICSYHPFFLCFFHFHHGAGDVQCTCAKGNNKKNEAKDMREWRGKEKKILN
jgi:hypothetical protein